MAFMKLGTLLKRGMGHFAAGIGIGFVGGKKAIAPMAVVVVAKEIQDPHPKENRKLWIFKSVTDVLEWTGGAILGAFIRKKIKDKK